MIGDLAVIGFGENGIGFSVHLLGDEIKLPPDASALGKLVARRLDVAAQPHQLFIHTDLVRIDRDLLGDP